MNRMKSDWSWIERLREWEDEKKRRWAERLSRIKARFQPEGTEPWNRDMQIIFLTMLIFYGIGSYMVVFDLAQVPLYGSPEYLEFHNYTYDNWFWGMPPPVYPERFWDFCIGDHFVSNIENIIMHLCLFFGFMRTIDLFRSFYDAGMI